MGGPELQWEFFFSHPAIRASRQANRSAGSPPHISRLSYREIFGIYIHSGVPTGGGGGGQGGQDESQAKKKKNMDKKKKKYHHG